MKPERVLIADDEDMICTLLALVLKRVDIASETVMSGADAVARVEATTGTPDAFDLLMLDMHMPDLDGTGVFQALEAAGVRPPTIVVTGDPRSEELARLKSLGCEGILPKPFTPSAVMDALKALP